MAKILITGGAGFIGSHLAEALVAQGDDVTVYDNLSTGYEHNLEHIRGGVKFVKGDLRDPSALASAMSGQEYVLHEAALASVPRSVADPLSSHENNATGTLNVLVAARDAGVKRVVYAGSSSAYGDSIITPKHEEIIPKPLSPYAVQKLMGEQYCRAFAEVYGMETLTIRYFNVFGPRQDPDSPYAAVLPIFLSHLLRGEAPTIEGDGHHTRDFTFVANVVEGNLKALAAEKTHGEVVNVACGGSYSVLYLYEQIRDTLGLDIKPVFGPGRPGDVPHSSANIDLAGKLLGYKPVVTFEEGLARTIEWYKKTLTTV
jgi:UDP-glucose 4-epimerase